LISATYEANAAISSDGRIFPPMQIRGSTERLVVFDRTSRR